MAEDNPLGATAMKVVAHLKARDTLLWVASPEEGRVEKALIEAATRAKYEVRLWDCVSGITAADGKVIDSNTSDMSAVLATIRSTALKTVWILRDPAFWLRDPQTLRATRNLAKFLPSQPVQRSIIFLSPTAEIPPELSDHAVLIKWDLPDRGEIGRIFDQAAAGLPDEKKIAANAVREQAIEAAVGLSAETVSSCYANSIVTQKGAIVPSVVGDEKKRIVKGKGLEIFDPDPRGLDAIGGLELIKPWLRARESAFSQRARDFGLPLPKGALLVGVPGCGKSLIAKAIPAAWGCPLVKLDLGATASKWVGESESQIREALARIDAIGRCVVLVDEIEKSLGGAIGGSADGGVSTDRLGTLLSWMQDRKSQAFLLATSNDVSKLPPELLRKGRFDELFFVDLPTPRERREILVVTLKQYKRSPDAVDVSSVAAACDGFTGSEIAAIVPDALFIAFADGERQITTADLIKTAGEVAPLSKTAAEKIAALREWAKGRARPASAVEGETTTASGGRNLDMMDL